jgi:hypothetical protein
MSILDGIRTWTWGTHTFGRVLSGSDSQPWFKQTTLSTSEPVLGASTRYVDLGGTTTEPLALRICFADMTAREDMVAAVGTVALLTNLTGQTSQAFLKDATRVNLADLALADVTFEAVTL